MSDAASEGSTPHLAATQVIASLIEARAMIAVVESCTGGLVAHQLTQIAGASRVFWGGWVTYDNSAKTSQVGVSPALIEAHGAVSQEVATAMAEGGLRELTAALSESRDAFQPATLPHELTAALQLCVSTTGVAGPGGGTARKPVGLCYIAIARAGHSTQVLKLQCPATQSREANQLTFAQAALDQIAQCLAKSSTGSI